MRHPFTEVTPSLAMRFRRLIHRRSVADTVIDINNRLARSGVHAITQGELERMCRQDRVPAAKLRTRLARFYRDYLVYCLRDEHLSEAEIEDLEHLQRALGLDAGTVDMIHRTVVRRVYSRSVEQMLADGAIDEQERRFLAQLRSHLDLPAEIADNIEEMKERQWRTRNPNPD